MTGRENRGSPRYEVALPVEVGCEKCTSRDVSTSGIFFETDKSFSPGQPIEFTIVLEHVDPAHPVRLKCLGKIVRVDESGQKIGVAAAISSYSFEALQEPEKGRHESREPKGPGVAAKSKGK